MNGTRQNLGRLEALALAAAMVMLLLGGCSCEGPAARATRSIAAPKPPGVPILRIKLGDDVPLVKVKVDGPYVVEDGGRRAFADASLPWTGVRVEGGRLAIGGAVMAGRQADFLPGHDGTIRVHPTGGCERGYRGFIRVAITREGAIRVINVVNMEAYLAGVVCNEMPGSWQLDALRAQAVAARTYALTEHNTHTKFDFDLFDSTCSQAYGGVAAETDKSRRAAAETWGIVGSYRGAGGHIEPLTMYYHSTCGGVTEAAGPVFGGGTPGPLRGGVECRYCYRSKRYTWSGVTVTKQELSEAVRQSGDPELVKLGPISRAEVAEETPGGRVAWVRLVGARNGATLLLRCDKFRMLVGATRVASNWFTMKDTGAAIKFEGRGYGHGVGMCQYGAQYLAEHGKTAEEILRYYYPGIELTKAY